MARKTKTVTTSDKSGATIAEGSGGTVRIRNAAGVAYRADVTTTEMNALIKELNAVKIGGTRAERVAERAAAKAEAENGDADDAGDGEGGEDEGESSDESSDESSEAKAA